VCYSPVNLGSYIIIILNPNNVYYIHRHYTYCRHGAALVVWSRDKEVTEDVQIGITIIIVKTKNSSEHV